MTTPTDPGPATNEAWSRLWASGALDSFGAAHAHLAAGALDTPLADHWKGVFEELPDRARVLDIGTGNGVLPVILFASCSQREVSCDAIDAAALSPAWIQQAPPDLRQRLIFHPRVKAEDLPFPDDHFDLVVSQFGIEYSDLAQSLSEARRVLRPGGTLHLVMHDAKARPAQLAAEEVAHVAWLLEKGWYDSAAGMAEAMALLGAPGGSVRLSMENRWTAVRSDFDMAQLELRGRADLSSCPDILFDAQNWMTQVFRQSSERQQADAHGLAHVRQLLEDTRDRLNDLLHHALDDENLQSIVGSLQSMQLSVTHETVAEAGHRMGWCVNATRSA